jgi:hypothetical protein
MMIPPSLFKKIGQLYKTARKYPKVKNVNTIDPNRPTVSTHGYKIHAPNSSPSSTLLRKKDQVIPLNFLYWVEIRKSTLVSR